MTASFSGPIGALLESRARPRERTRLVIPRVGTTPTPRHADTRSKPILPPPSLSSRVLLYVQASRHSLRL